MKIDKFITNKNFSIRKTMEIIDKNALGTAFVVNDKKELIGVVTDGDIRQAILGGINIEKKIWEIANENPVVIHAEIKEKEIAELNNNKDVKKKIPVKGSLKIPVINNKKIIEDIAFLSADDNKNTFLSKSKVKGENKTIKKVLVVGGAGYLGSVLCSELLNRGYRVRVLDNLIYGDSGVKKLFKNKEFELSKGDIRNLSDVVDAIKDVDAVIHLAAIVGDTACLADPEKTLEINYLATKNLAETCKYFQINRFIFASTCSVYGQSLLPDQQLTEDSPLNPVSLYAETKIKCEQTILSSVDENFSPTIFRMATLYGYSPNMRFDLAINLLTAKAIFEKKIPIFGGDQWRPWLHLQDAASAYIKCLEKPIEDIKGEIFNVVSENYKVIEVGKIINKAIPLAELIISDKAIDKRDYNVSFSKISKKLNFKSPKKIADGVFEIKEAIDKKIIKDYKSPAYRFLA